jgi:carbon storage regulator
LQWAIRGEVAYAIYHGLTQEEFAMLVLTRKAGEEIHIGDDIVIVVGRVKGRRALLGIDAPSSVTIRRKELLFDNPGHIGLKKNAQKCSRLDWWRNQSTLLVGSIDMTSPKTQSAVVDRVMREHDALRAKLREIHSVLAQPEPTSDDIETLLREFINTLLVHFSTEENEGFFDEVTAHASRLSGEAGKLCIEHKQLLREADELCRFAAAGSPSITWWRELHSRCHVFSKRLMHHESEENKLLQEAYQSDIGAYD